MTGPLTHKLRTAVDVCTDQAYEHPSTAGKSSQVSTPQLRIYPQLLASGEESVFFKGVAFVRLPTLEGMVPHQGVCMCSTNWTTVVYFTRRHKVGERWKRVVMGGIRGRSKF